MRRILALTALIGAAVLVVAQGRGTDLVANFTKALNDAKSMKATYTVQTVGGAPQSFDVELAKPNRARIDGPEETIVADGKEIVTYSKSAKTFYRRPQTDAELLGLLGSQELMLWRPFFNPKAFSDIAQARATGSRTVAGVTYQILEVSFDARASRTATLYLSTRDGVPRIAEMVADSHGAKETTILNARSLELGKEPAAGAFAFNPPDGARELSLEEMNSAKWYTNLEEAMGVAKRTNRALMVDFYADW
jgi:outer membrane lipoprotein-sorting protein